MDGIRTTPQGRSLRGNWGEVYRKSKAVDLEAISASSVKLMSPSYLLGQNLQKARVLVPKERQSKVVICIWTRQQHV